jgi:hypothetical protein
VRPRTYAVDVCAPRPRSSGKGRADESRYHPARDRLAEDQWSRSGAPDTSTVAGTTSNDSRRSAPLAGARIPRIRYRYSPRTRSSGGRAPAHTVDLPSCVDLALRFQPIVQFESRREAPPFSDPVRSSGDPGLSLFRRSGMPGQLITFDGVARGGRPLR